MPDAVGAARRQRPDRTTPDNARANRHVAAILVAAVAFRALSALIAFLSNVVLPHYQPDQFPSPFGGSAWWDPFVRYDAGNFYQIARYGYTGGPMAFVPGGRSTIAYFPVYPLLMRYVGRLVGPRAADLYFGGIAVSWTAFAVAMVVVWKLAELEVGESHGWRATIYAAVFPFAFFFGVVYSESTFLLLAVSAFYAFRTRRFVAGGVAGGLATATRVNGILMLPALAWLAWREVRRAGAPRASVVRAVAGLALVPAGITAYSLYIYRLTGNPFEWAATIERWGYHPGGPPWTPLLQLARVLVAHPYAYLAGERMAPYDALNGVAAIAFAMLTPIVWWRLGAAYGLFMAANLWLPLSSGQFEGMGRYCSVLFPCFLWLARIRNPVVAAGIVVGFALFYTLCLALFTTIHPLF